MKIIKEEISHASSEKIKINKNGEIDNLNHIIIVIYRWK